LVQIILRERDFKNCTNQRPDPFQREDNQKTEKMGWGNLKIFFSQTREPEELIFT
jgi:hypothetical protein